MHDDDPVHEQACEVEAEDGIVVVSGPDELRARFSPECGWTMLACRPAEFQSRIQPVPAIAACMERTAS